MGDLVRLRRTQVTVDPLETYREIGIRSFGKGIFHKEPIGGEGLGAKRVFEVHPGDLVLSNVFAWEGAIARATDAEKGMIGSHRFMTYEAKSEDIDLAWLHYFLLGDAGLARIRSASPGSAGRNRTLGVKAFEDLQIPLPGIKVQRRVVRGIDGALRHQAQLSQSARRSVERRDPILDASIDDLIARCFAGGWRSAALCEVAVINPRPVAVAGDNFVTFVPMSEVDELTGAIRASAPVMRVEDLQSNYRQFRSGDVLFARITPCMQNGKAAIANLGTEVGYGSTEFHVVRSNGPISNRWIHQMLRAQRFRAEAATRFTGTAGQQRVPADFMRQAVIPVPPTEAEQTRVLAQIDRLEAARVGLHRLSSARRPLVEALRPAILNQAFAGLA